ncbi:conserved hypothetical protein [Candidatus Desulfarcum epimagneticum]|uniref:Polymerase/histidinol phosphatase N-terminal domain-containing protein n=1 Tax=uncultured Desulfobacteraceae bacterium TaxID=218296 RepID=A0A484HFG8_9BACT|nr:conserved hypothetical protein [uncultured Desulfobacteraceae bacterium]
MKAEQEILDSFKKSDHLDVGARFYKADLHFHTPASEDARGRNRYHFNPYKIAYPKDRDAPDYRERVAEIHEKIRLDSAELAKKIVARFLEVGLSLVAVTDHNGIGTIRTDDESESRHMDLSAPTWYEMIDDQAQKVNHAAGKTILTILPGVEISTTGMHVLAIFPPQKPRRQIHFMICDLLHEAGFSPDEWGKNPEVGTASVFDVIELITRKGGLAIPAHIDGSDQSMLKLFKLTSGAMKDVLKSPNLSAVEVVNPQKFMRKDRKLKKSLHKWITGLRAKEGLYPFAYFQGSDAHDIPSIAKRHTYVKMTEPSFSGLETAIRMPSSRVRVSAFHQGESPGFFLRSLHLNTDDHGRRDIRFNRGLNCVTGKKGAGKGGIFALMRRVSSLENSPGARSVILIVDQVSDSGTSHYAFCQFGKKTVPGFYEIDPVKGAVKKTDRVRAIEHARELGVLPKFFNAAKIGDLVSSPDKMNVFLTKHFGAPSKQNAGAFNQRFALPGFLEEKPDPLLWIEAKNGVWRLFVNRGWRKKKEEMTAFFDLGVSLKKTAVLCMIFIMGRFGPTIVSAPEADFDNRHITDFLVPVIKSNKDRQQGILFTNNPILAVNTDPDNYVILDSLGGKVKKIESGFAIDDLDNKEALLDIVEGSVKSIKRRISVYDL